MPALVPWHGGTGATLQLTGERLSTYMHELVACCTTDLLPPGADDVRSWSAALSYSAQMTGSLLHSRSLDDRPGSPTWPAGPRATS